MRQAPLAAALWLGLSGAASADILVAVAGPMTGQYGVFGEQMRIGAAQAVADINERGGVLGERLVLEVGDDACEAARATALANQLAGKGVRLVAGHFCSIASIPASAVYAQERIVQIAPASITPRFTDERPGPGIFRLAARADRQGAVAGAYLAERFAEGRIAIVHDGTAYGRGLADQARAVLARAGQRADLFDGYSPGEQDYGALVSRLDSMEIEVLYVGGYHDDAALIARQMRARGMDTLIVSGDALATEEYWAIAGPAAEGTLMTAPPDPRQEAGAAALVEAFRARGVEPEGYVLPTYAAIQLWAQAAEAAGSTHFEAVADALGRGAFPTVLGEVAFDDKGDATLPGFVLYLWRDGAYHVLDGPAPAGDGRG